MTSFPVDPVRPGVRRWAPAVVAVLAAVSLTAGCASSTSSGAPVPGSATTVATNPPGTIDEGKAVDGGKLVIGVPAESGGYNPAMNQWTDSGNLVGSSVLEPLAAVGEDSLAKPWLAESWTPNETNTVWTLKLRKGVTFHNGEKFDATAVKLNFEFFLKAPLTSLGLGLLDSVTVVDDLTAKINLKKPWGAFPNSILDGPFYMMAPEMLLAPDQGQAHPIGTGPFVFDSWQPDSAFKVVKNPNYWQKGLPHLDSLEFRMISDDSSRINALNSGDVNAILTKRAADAVSAEGKGDTVTKDWNSENVFAMANTSASIDGVDNPMANLHARKALAYATDRKSVAETEGEGLGVPTSPWGPDSPWGMPDKDNGYIDFDLDKAKAEVEAYKKDTGKPSLAFTLTGTIGVDDGQLMQMLQSQWAAAGADVTLLQLEESPFIANTVTSKYQVAISRNYAFPDPDTNYAFWSSTTAKGSGKLSINMTQFTNEKLDAALELGRESTDVGKRTEAYHEVTRQINGAFTHFWLYRTPYSLISAPAVKGWNTPRSIGFSSYGPRTWLGELWLSR